MADPTLAQQARINDAAERIAQSAVSKFADAHPEIGHIKAEIPSPLKWAAGVIAALFTMGIAGMAFWLVSSVSAVQVTLARMDERQIQQSSNQEAWKTDISRRLDKLETVLARSGNKP